MIRWLRFLGLGLLATSTVRAFSSPSFGSRSSSEGRTAASILQVQVQVTDIGSLQIDASSVGQSSEEAATPPPPPPLNTYPEMPEDLVQCMSATEWRQRCELAASYRIAYLHDWHENIFNHITTKLEGTSDEKDGPHFLLNDFGIGFDEITACNLLKVTLDGCVVDCNIPPERRTVNPGEGRVFKPGYVLHSAIHGSRHDVNTIWHGHDLDATAVSQTKFGILPLSQEATFTIAKGISYHPFEGSVNSLDEQSRLVANLGPTNQILMLEDHGPIVACKSTEEAFAGMYFLTRACQFQVKSLSAAGGDLGRIHVPDDGALEEMKVRADKFDEAPQRRDEEKAREHDTPGLMFAYARRSAERHFGPGDIYR